MSASIEDKIRPLVAEAIGRLAAQRIDDDFWYHHDTDDIVRSILRWTPPGQVAEDEIRAVLAPLASEDYEAVEFWVEANIEWPAPPAAEDELPSSLDEHLAAVRATRHQEAS